MRPRDVSTLLTSTINARLPVLLVGAPGVGKSDLVAQAAQASGADLIVSHPVVSDPTDAKGLPWVGKDGESATFLPFGDLSRALHAEQPTVWFLDDLGQATPAVQASYMQLLLARRVNGHALPECVTFVAATNRRTDRAGVSGILESVKSRFVSIVHVEANLDDWCNWALRTNQPAELVAFVRFRPELLHQFNPTADLVNSPCPRTWAAAGKIIALKLSPAIELAALQGAVGDGPAAEFVAFLQIYRELPSLDAILLDPDSAPLPSQPAALYAVATGLAARATEANFARVAKYAMRLNDAGRGEFAVLLLRDAVRRNAKLIHSPPFLQLLSSDIGKLISGEVDDGA
jgi:hypothetical protein